MNGHSAVQVVITLILKGITRKTKEQLDALPNVNHCTTSIFIN